MRGNYLSSRYQIWDQLLVIGQQEGLPYYFSCLRNQISCWWMSGRQKEAQLDAEAKSCLMIFSFNICGFSQLFSLGVLRKICWLDISTDLICACCVHVHMAAEMCTCTGEMAPLQLAIFSCHCVCLPICAASKTLSLRYVFTFVVWSLWAAAVIYPVLSVCEWRVAHRRNSFFRSLEGD